TCFCFWSGRRGRHHHRRRRHPRGGRRARQPARSGEGPRRRVLIRTTARTRAHKDCERQRRRRRATRITPTSDIAIVELGPDTGEEGAYEHSATRALVIASTSSP